MREEGRPDNDFSSGLIAVWIMLQILIWPISLFVILWQKLRWNWFVSLIAAAAFTTLGYLAWGDNFYFLLGALGIVAAASVVTYAIVWND